MGDIEWLMVITKTEIVLSVSSRLVLSILELETSFLTQVLDKDDVRVPHLK